MMNSGVNVGGMNVGGVNVGGVNVGGENVANDEVCVGREVTAYRLRRQGLVRAERTTLCGARSPAAAAEHLAVQAALSRAIVVAGRLGVSRAELAKVVGVGLDTMENWLRVDRPNPIPAYRLTQLCRALPAAASAALWAELATLAVQEHTPADRQPLRTQVCEITQAAGNVSAAVLASTADDSEQGADLSEAERRKIVAAVGELVTEGIEIAVAAAGAAAGVGRKERGTAAPKGGAK